MLFAKAAGPVKRIVGKGDRATVTYLATSDDPQAILEDDGQ